jgi:molecular chaperone DnaK (HSP70)
MSSTFACVTSTGFADSGHWVTCVNYMYVLCRFDRTLGGMEFQLRLRDFLVKQFNAVKKSKNDMMKDFRALQKLFKEAGRLKQVLSANADHFAQVRF